ncbi:hypothetical protein LSI54_08785 [Nesterenkonia sp. AY15]|uniref:hypothetical protein n=1 Tax=unclassified Nesterenkonia TaxID=2629769 RepID=UPI001F4CB54D|nr:MULTISPECIES: hypothetical protein [unclassified Nesterenkonia]MCH8563025.1 hypothetical protein [Nesterenkonia sp. YGD6]MCH8571446.1 hypothetical protein [Nesterenkonia sp. AY15]
MQPPGHAPGRDSSQRGVGLHRDQLGGLGAEVQVNAAGLRGHALDTDLRRPVPRMT